MAHIYMICFLLIREAATDEENKDTDAGAQEAPADLDFTVDLEGITTAKLSAALPHFRWWHSRD